MASADGAFHAQMLGPDVIAGHRALNPARSILPGEWLELCALQQVHGVEQLLIWQAGATRATTERPHGITPAYYRACAARATPCVERPVAAARASARRVAKPGAERPLLEPACESLLRTMGVRERQKLADVPYDLIVAWNNVLDHPGLTGQFVSPIGFAVSQMQRGHAPPAVLELDRWAERARRTKDRYETWRHVERSVIADTAVTAEQQLEARVRALAPPDADLAELCALAFSIEAGATDSEALAALYAARAGERG